MRRKAGILLPLERDILAAGLALNSSGNNEFHGYHLAREIQTEGHAARLTGYGTLYKALERLQAAGLLESRWEDAELAAAERRPRRRLYRVTAAGASALSRAVQAAPLVRRNAQPQTASG